MPSQMPIGSPEWRSVIVNGAGELGVAVTDGQAAHFAMHAREMMRWNRKINLTAISDPYEIAVKHYLDSIAAVPFIKPGSTLLDVGSGAGFPGIPLKIMIPSLCVTLLDARRKRVNFMKQAIRLLDIGSIRACHDRLERAAESLPSGGGYDLIVSRAFSDLKWFVAQALPLLKKGGKLIAYKGRQEGRFGAELSWPAKTGRQDLKPLTRHAGFGRSMEIRQFTLPYLNIERILVLLNR